MTNSLDNPSRRRLLAGLAATPVPGAPASSSARLKLIQHNAEWLALGEKARAHGFAI